jgi:uncharacterized protein (DUF2147 family)
MNRLGGLAALAALAAALPAHAAPDPAIGEWLVAGGGGRVRVAACPADPARLCGVLVWLKNALDASGAPVRDAANPDAALRRRPLVGQALISGFRREAAGRWVDGRIYDPDSGRTYRSTMRVAADGTLKVAGCVLFVCQAQTWTRVAD